MRTHLNGRAAECPASTDRIIPCCLLLLWAPKLLPIQLLVKATEQRKNIFDISGTQAKYIDTDASLCNVLKIPRNTKSQNMVPDTELGSSYFARSQDTKQPFELTGGKLHFVEILRFQSLIWIPHWNENQHFSNAFAWTEFLFKCCSLAREVCECWIPSSEGTGMRGVQQLQVQDLLWIKGELFTKWEFETCTCSDFWARH